MTNSRFIRHTVIVGVLLSISLAVVSAQRGVGVPRVPLGDGPWVFDTAEQHKVRVVAVTKGLANPWSLAFLPSGEMLITERSGRLRIIRNGVLDSQPVAGVPQSKMQRLGGLMDVVLHPRFAENRFVYLTYSKPGDKDLIATALGRGTWDGSALTNFQELFVVEPWWDGQGGAASQARSPTLGRAREQSAPGPQHAHVRRRRG